METEITEKIILKGVRVNNLKNIDIELPHNKLIVITGLSGSGKSSLAFDTLFAEGQRRYIESLSAYARQFLGRMHKPELDSIQGIPPAVAIQQKVINKNPRSTVGTTTEIYDYLQLLFARIGKIYSPISGNEVKKHSISNIVDFITNLKNDTQILICFKQIINNEDDIKTVLKSLVKQGYLRLVIDSKVIKIDDLLLENENIFFDKNELTIVLDRVTVGDNSQNSRISDSVQTAIFEGKGECLIAEYEKTISKYYSFSTKLECDGMTFTEITPQTFSFNNSLGACSCCEGFGRILGIDEDLVIPNKNLSIFENAVACWRGEFMQEYKNQFIINSSKYNFPIHRPYYQLSEKEKNLLWDGNKDIIGINKFFELIEKQKHKIQNRIIIARYRGNTVCPVCKGHRLKKESNYVKINGYSISDLVDIPISKLKEFFDSLILEHEDAEIAKRLLKDIKERIQVVIDVGLHYLTLNRASITLSGGESQRINLATILGSGLVGSLYVLDEPSIGLHPRDTEKLIQVLKALRDKENTVVVVEHDEEIIRAADYIVDVGPLAGIHGGEIVFAGSLEKLLENKESLTAKYLRKELSNDNLPSGNKQFINRINIIGARHHNLKNIDVCFPLGVITVVTGVSGSGKTSLVKGILFPAIKQKLNISTEKIGNCSDVNGDIKFITDIEYVDQNPIGKSSRSNPATYIKVFDEIRKLFSKQKLSVLNGYTAGHFSFNSDGGRCEICKGEGDILVEMQFLADVHLKCEACDGKRYKDEILDVKYRDKNIYDVLEMSVSEAIEFFSQEKTTTNNSIVGSLQLLYDVGLGYVKLGQSSTTLSGGEAQRIKLAGFLSKGKGEPKIFVFDEPTTGLHFHDISKLLESLIKLRNMGHTIIIIEHNPEVIRNADYIIDLGPDGGENGGSLIFQGNPKELKKNSVSKTAKYI